MNPVKVFLCVEGPRLLKELIEEVYRTRDFKADVTTYEEHFLTQVPRDYDIYFIHLSQVAESALEEIRNEQQYSFIVGIAGGGFDKYPSSSTRACHRIQSVVSARDLEEYLDSWSKASF